MEKQFLKEPPPLPSPPLAAPPIAALPSASSPLSSLPPANHKKGTDPWDQCSLYYSGCLRWQDVSSQTVIRF